MYLATEVRNRLMLVHRRRVAGIAGRPQVKEESESGRMIAINGFQGRRDAVGRQLNTQAHVHGRQSQGQIAFIAE